MPILSSLLFVLAIQPQFMPGPSESARTLVLIGAQDHEARALQKRFNVYSIPELKPDREPLIFPPPGTAYRQNGSSHFLWRWLGLQAPDLAIISGEQDYGLADALRNNSVVGMGRIPVQRVLTVANDLAKSEVHLEQDRRRARTPRQLADELAQFYGHDFEQPVYIPAMSLIARLRLGDQSEVADLAAPYVDGRKDSLANATSSHLAGHLLFAELAEHTHDQRYVDRVRAAADLADSKPMHNEMSDAVFMECPILACAGKLTGEAKYFDLSLRHFQFMQNLCRRPDGLYRHSPLNEAAWGRGNAFPALGLSWSLLKIPESHPAFAELLKAYRSLIATLAKYQDTDGMWHEVIDHPESYGEFSATAMIATAMQRGITHGWLDRSYEPRVQAAWRAILTRVGPGGVLVDVCESTGKQKTLEDYFNRAASFGRDTRGGGMAPPRD